MLLDAKTIPDGKLLSADICIIGGGAAGITLARELADRFSILLVEAGGVEADPAVQNAYEGAVSGNLLDEMSADGEEGRHYLHTTRTRFLGGSTNCWFGICRPLDAGVFSHRPWVPHSGWPITRASLDNYYRKAAVICGIDKEYASHDEDDGRRFPAAVRLEPAREYKSPAYRFGSKYRDELENEETVSVCLGGSVTDLVCNQAGDEIDYITIATLAGNSFRAEAGLFILATGAIENTRILLAANSVHKSGIGNSSGHLGRYFMDHLYPKFNPGVAALTRTYWEGRTDYYDFGLWMLDADLRSRHGLLNVGIDFRNAWSPRQEIDPQVLSTTAAIDRRGEQSGVVHKSLLTFLRLHIELAPSPDNRITLAKEVDALGMPRVHLDWNLTELDRYSMKKTLELFSIELGRNLAGRIASGTASMVHAYGPHHAGTTRMSTAPQDGVVDPHCRVHDVGNLYVAGSSVFPSCGIENPTFTIIALALRLADHLGKPGH